MRGVFHCVRHRVFALSRKNAIACYCACRARHSVSYCPCKQTAGRTERVMRICALKGCGRPIHGLGYCNPHYQRLTRHGSPTAGSTSRGSPMAWLDDALFIQTDECVIFPFGRTSDGRSNIKFGEKTTTTCRLMCLAANGNPPSSKHQAAHSCGNGHLSCVNPRHLRWATDAENKKDREIHKSVKGPAAVQLIECGRKSN